MVSFDATAYGRQHPYARRDARSTAPACAAARHEAKPMSPMTGYGPSRAPMASSIAVSACGRCLCADASSVTGPNRAQERVDPDSPESYCDRHHVDKRVEVEQGQKVPASTCRASRGRSGTVASRNWHTAVQYARAEAVKDLREHVPPQANVGCQVRSKRWPHVDGLWCHTASSVGRVPEHCQPTGNLRAQTPRTPSRSMMRSTAP